MSGPDNFDNDPFFDEKDVDLIQWPSIDSEVPTWVLSGGTDPE